MKQSYLVLFFLITTARIGSGIRLRFSNRASSHGYHVNTRSSGYGSSAAHSYPASPRLSGFGSDGGYRNHASTGQHGVAYNNYSPKIEVHHHYRPPPHISYGSTFHPVYQGHPPIYVYQYRNSGSRYDNLLTGLALYNMGRNSHRHNSMREYSSTSDEICKLGISKPNGENEETRIDCNLMSSFIWEDTTSAARNEQHAVKNTTAVTVTQTVNGTGNSSVTVTSTTVEDALKVKGPSIAVTPGMTCYMIRTYGGATVLRKSVDCGLL